MPVIDAIKANIFSTPMPDMPAKLREMWQVAFMYRRKYSGLRGDEDPETLFSAAWSDATFIAESYGNGETIQSLMAEVYEDIERQYKTVRARLEEQRSPE